MNHLNLIKAGRGASDFAFASLLLGWRWLSLMLVLGFISFSASAQNPNSIVFSKHNLSVSGPGSVHATTESDICIFCHTPHQATSDGPLWNHGMSSEVYVPYSSATLKATVGQPTGSSRLCLGCHDGTVALGLVHSRNSVIPMNNTTMPAGVNNLGTDLSSDHSVSFTYDAALVTANGSLRDPNTLPADVRLDRASQMQCSSCHDPHNNQYGSFLVMDNTGSALCMTCHTIAPWTLSSHAISSTPIPAALVSPLTKQPTAFQNKSAAKKPTVAGAACASCHVSHTAGSKKELMRFSSLEKNCLVCHAGEGPGQNIAADMNKFSAHSTLSEGDTHSAQEDPVNPPTRHATCTDCHNPHASNKSLGGQMRLPGALNAVAGITAGGSKIHAVTHEYELCYRCHGDSAQRGPAVVPRQFVETNTRREFDPGNVSFHPVETTGKNPVSPSLILPLNAASTIDCKDCHNSDQGPAAGGTGARGPHGSSFAPILERMLLTTDGTPYNPANFALCFKCHSSTVVDSDLNTSWQFHRKHIEDYRAACTTCHDSHAASQPHLINFNTAYVQPLNGALRYTSTGMNHGVCTLTCHDGAGQNKPHDAKSY